MSAYFFDSFAIEIYNSTWTDVTADVLVDPSPAWNRGIISNDIDDHIGHAGNFTFSLNNSISNSAGLAGWYSPGHANCWPGWTTGLPVRLSFTFEGATRYKYKGIIKPDGITVIPGSYGSHRVNVTCGDWMWQLGNYKMEEVSYAANVVLGTLINSVNTNMPIYPTSDYIENDYGFKIFPSVFDNTTIRSTALSEYIKGAMSEWADIYVKGNNINGETLVIDNKFTRSNKTISQVTHVAADSPILLLESGDYLLLEDGSTTIALHSYQNAIYSDSMITDATIEYGKNLVNRVSATVYPRKIDADATNILFSTERRIRLEPSETISNYQTAYNDPNNPNVRISGISFTTPVSGTDYIATANEDGTGANMTSDLSVTVNTFAEASYWDLTNNNTTTTMYIYLQVRGQGSYQYDPITRVRSSSDSQNTYGVIPMDVDMKYLTDPREAEWMSEYLIKLNDAPRSMMEKCTLWTNASSLNMNGFMYLEPGDKITISETLSGISDNYFINGYDASIIGGKFVRWSPTLKKDPEYLSIWDNYLEGTGTSKNLRNINYSSNGFFFAVGDSATIGYLSSTDGASWTIHGTLPSSDNNYTSICYSPALTMFCAVAENGATSDQVMTSTDDGAIFIAQSSSVLNTWQSVCWAPALTLFCAVADTGATSDQVMTSPDGVTWTSRTSAEANPWKSVCWAEEINTFVAVAHSGTNPIMSSTDGVTWTARAAPTSDTHFNSVCWSAELGIFCAVRDLGNSVISSTDGITWTAHTAINAEWKSICWASDIGYFAAVAAGSSDGNELIMVSTDGSTWSQRQSPSGTKWNSIAYSPDFNVFVAVSNYGKSNLMISNR